MQRLYKTRSILGYTSKKIPYSLLLVGWLALVSGKIFFAFQ